MTDTDTRKFTPIAAIVNGAGRVVILATRPHAAVAVRADGSMGVLAVGRSPALALEGAGGPDMEFDEATESYTVYDAFGDRASVHAWMRKAVIARSALQPRAEPCTERLHRHVQAHGADVAIARNSKGLWEIARDARPLRRISISLAGRAYDRRTGLRPVANDGGLFCVSVDYLVV